MPKSHREVLFHAAHHNPMAGHLGQDKTLTHLMALFFGWAFAVMYVGGVHHAGHGNWWIRQPSQKYYCSWHYIQSQFPLNPQTIREVHTLCVNSGEIFKARSENSASRQHLSTQVLQNLTICKSKRLTKEGTMFMSWTLHELYDVMGIKSICTMTEFTNNKKWLSVQAA